MNAAVDTTAIPTATRRFGFSSARAWFAITVLVVLAGWVVPLGDYLTPRSGLGYWLGIIGGSLMLLLLIYPLRKRVPGLQGIGSARVWFQIHMALGVVGPVFILYHCVYHLGATNSNVALWSMVIVSSSGVVGRYLYGRIHHGLYGRKASLEELRADADRLKVEGAGAGRLLPELASRVDRAEKLIGINIPVVPKALSAMLFWRFARWRLRVYVLHALHGAAAESTIVADHRRAFGFAANRYAEARLTAARRVGEFESCVRLFGLWHMLHIPLFGMLFVAGIVHVIAVNIY